ncbi:MAG: RtcB family protein [Bacillota bacterium]
MAMTWKGKLRRLDDVRWEIPTSYKPGMRVPALIYANDSLQQAMLADEAPEQAANVAFLPGIVGRSLAMPDIHWGYGFPIGGVAATSVEDGVIVPGGIGYDINCGVRLLHTSIMVSEIRDRLPLLLEAVATGVPAGVGSSGALKLSDKELDEVLNGGAVWAVRQGYGTPEDLNCQEDGGRLPANPAAVSGKARSRGRDQLGTLGSGNHFLELDEVAEIHNEEAARVFGLRRGQLVVSIHTGSRGLGHQVCTDYLQSMQRAVQTYGFKLPDRQLVCAPVRSEEGQAYLGAMRAAANYAWANRQILTHLIRQSLAKVLGVTVQQLGAQVVYDVAHNIAKIEKHTVDGRELELCVHRKGATRAFPAGHPDVPPAYRQVGQPVLVPGDMGRSSWVMVGLPGAMNESFGSTCHGAGRTLSRSVAKQAVNGRELQSRLAQRGILVRAEGGYGSLAEEAPEAYKDVDAVVDTAERAGLSGKVARLRPLGVIKG